MRSDEPLPEPSRLKMKKLHQIAHLVHMLRRWRRASAAALSSPRLRRSTSSSSAHLPPAGYLAVYVGEERLRFEVRAEKLNHPLFRGVLAKTQEFGWEQPGALSIACDVASFERLLHMTDLMQDAEEEGQARRLHRGGSGHGDARLLELLCCHVRHPEVVKEEAACGIIMLGFKNGECVQHRKQGSEEEGAAFRSIRFWVF